MKRRLLIFLLLSALLPAVPCGGDSYAAPAPPSPSPEPTLIFQTGFGGTTALVPRLAASQEAFTGTDVLPLSNFDEVREKRIAELCVNYTGGDISKRHGAIIPEPGNTSNKILQYVSKDYWVADANSEKTRVEVVFYKIEPSIGELYQKVRIRLAEDFNELKNYDRRISWLTIAEFWNNAWFLPREENGFRITVGVGKPAGVQDHLNFIVNAENMENNRMVEKWNADNTNVPVPVGQWFTVEYYLKEGNADTGRFYMAITPDGGQKQVVCDVHDFTHNTFDPSPDGLTHYNPMKLYTSKGLITYLKERGKRLEVWWDDLEIYENGKPGDLF
jgi:hypothetical protein